MQIPLFPLRAVFYPGEKVPLHIFEERYKALIADCREQAITFGIPVYIHGKLSHGIEVQLMEVVNTYENGAMDIVCVARQAFRLLRFEEYHGDKPYPGGEILHLDMVNDTDPQLKERVYSKIQELYQIMEVPFTKVPKEHFNSYTLAHKMGLSFEQEFELLKIRKETDRLKFIAEHLQQTIDVLLRVNHTRDMIELNGHFRNFDPLDFEEFKVE